MDSSVLGYLATGVGIILPLHFMGEIVKTAKREFLEPIEATSEIGWPGECPS